MPVGITAAGWGAIAAGVGAATSVAGAVASSGASSGGGGQIAAADQQAAQNQQAQYQQTRQDLLPYQGAGTNALQSLRFGLGVGGWNGQGGDASTRQLPAGWRIEDGGTRAEQDAVHNHGGISTPAGTDGYSVLYDQNGNQVATGGSQADLIGRYGIAGGVAQPAGYGSLTAPFDMSPEALANTPGYKFNLQQGLQATQNSAAARGLGVSGAALRSAADYATGLADSTWQSQANNYYAGQNNAYNKLYGVANLGENAAATTGAQGVQSTLNSGNALVGGATAQAQGGVGAANSIGGIGTGISNAYNSYQQNKLYQAAIDRAGMYTPSTTGLDRGYG